VEARKTPRRSDPLQPDEDLLHLPNLLLKHPNATIATYIRRQIKHLKYASETHAKTPKNT
jgi:hypothetical protein